MVTLKKALASWIPAREALLLRDAIKWGRNIALKHGMIKGYNIYLVSKDGSQYHTWDLRKVKV